MHKQLEKKQKTKEKGVERYSDEESCYNQKKISLTLNLLQFLITIITESGLIILNLTTIFCLIVCLI